MNKFYTHKKSTPTATFERLCLAFKDRLEKEKPLDTKQIDWLVRQEHLNKADKNLHSSYEIRLLDQLTPLLGYDWRETHAFIAFNNMVCAIENRLAQGKTLLSYQNNWLTTQRRILVSAPQVPSHALQIKQITKATAQLGYDWKVGKITLDFNTIYQSILDTISHGHMLSNSQKRWLANQKKTYTRNENIALDQMLKLNNLIDKLDLDWAEQRDAYMKKKQIKKWLKKFYTHMDSAVIENKLCLASGTLDFLYTNRLSSATDISTPYIEEIYDFLVAIQNPNHSRSNHTDQQEVVLWIKRNYYFLNPVAIANTLEIPKEVLEEIYTTDQVDPQWVDPLLLFIKNLELAKPSYTPQ